MRLAFVAALLIISGYCLAAERDIPPAVAALERDILNARRSIQSGEFEIHMTSNAKFVNERTDHFWLGSDGQIRQERAIGNELQVSILDRQFAYYYSAKPGQMEDPDLTHRKFIERRLLKEVRRDAPPHMICDPRVIMFTPVQYVLHPYYGLESIINSAGRRELTLIPIAWKGLEGKRVSFISKVGNHCEYDVVPSRDFNIVRWRLSGVARQRDGSGMPFEDILEADLTQVAGTSVWFPARTRLHGTRNGQPSVEETVTIAVTHLNEAIPDDVFTLGFSNKLPPKQLVIGEPIYTLTTRPTTRIARGPEAQPLYWDAGKLRPLTLRDEVERKLSGHHRDQLASSNRMKWVVFLLICIGVTALGAWAWGMTHSHGTGEQRQG